MWIDVYNFEIKLRRVQSGQIGIECSIPTCGEFSPCLEARPEAALEFLQSLLFPRWPAHDTAHDTTGLSAQLQITAGRLPNNLIMLQHRLMESHCGEKNPPPEDALQHDEQSEAKSYLVGPHNGERIEHCVRLLRDFTSEHFGGRRT